MTGRTFVLFVLRVYMSLTTLLKVLSNLSLSLSLSLSLLLSHGAVNLDTCFNPCLDSQSGSVSIITLGDQSRLMWLKVYVCV